LARLALQGIIHGRSTARCRAFVSFLLFSGAFAIRRAKQAQQRITFNDLG
jgi:hypothetical protein